VKLIIPTHNRSKTITTPYLEVFKNYEVILLVHDEEQYIEDKKTGKKYKAKTPLQVYNVCKKLKLFKN